MGFKYSLSEITDINNKLIQNLFAFYDFYEGITRMSFFPPKSLAPIKQESYVYEIFYP